MFDRDVGQTCLMHGEVFCAKSVFTDWTSVEVFLSRDLQFAVVEDEVDKKQQCNTGGTQQRDAPCVHPKLIVARHLPAVPLQ